MTALECTGGISSTKGVLADGNGSIAAVRGQALVRRSLIRRVPGLVLAFSAALLSAPAVAQDQFETPAIRSAAEILPKELLAGPHYSIQDRVLSHGYMLTWTVNSDFGKFRVTGNGALRKVIREIYAIAALKEVSQTEAFAESIKSSATAPFEFAGDLITDPVDTVSGIPEGIFSLFGNIAQAVSMEHDPSEDSKLASALQVSSWKRDYAAKNHVDVYSSNKILQEEMNRVGWAAAVGGLSFSAALMPFSGPAALVVKNVGLANKIGDIVAAEPPPRLRIINRQKLDAMGISEDLAEAFLDHPAFTPRHDTVIVACLAELKQAKGRDLFLKTILAAKEEQTANFYMNMAETMRGYNELRSPITDIRIWNGLVLAAAQSGRVLIPFPLDHGVWTKRAAGLMARLKAESEAMGFREGYDFWVAGTVSPLASERGKELGIDVTQNVSDMVGFVD